MKAFLEEYGLIVVATVIVIVLAVAAPSIGKSITDNVSKTVKTQTQMGSDDF